MASQRHLQGSLRVSGLEGLGLNTCWASKLSWGFGFGFQGRISGTMRFLGAPSLGGKNQRTSGHG